MTADQVRAGSGAPQGLDVSAIPYEPGEFNLNGIVAKGGRKLVVVDSFSGKLFRIELGDDGASIDAIDEIEGATVPGGDGMLLDRGRLVVVQGEPRNQLSFLKLRRGAARRGSSARRRATSSAGPRPSTRRRACTSSSTPTSPPARSRSPWRGSRGAPGTATTDGRTPAARTGGGGVPGYSYWRASSTFRREARRAGMTAAPMPASTAISVNAEQRLDRERDRQVAT